ncbi:MAG: TusE/DsrC/DsvC family sulfur relay protein [Acidobacteriota bacterium]
MRSAMQTEQLILQRLDHLSLQLDELARGRRATDELVEELTPIAREAIATAIVRLDALDKQGHFAFVAELVQVGRRVVEGFTPQDVRQLGDAIVAILDVVRALTRPEILQIARDAAGALGDAEHARPMGALRAVRATRDDDVRKGLGLLVDVLRRIGHGVNAAPAHDGKSLDQRAKLAELLGPRRQARLLPAPQALPAHRAAPPAPAPPPEERRIDPASWTRALGETIAREQGVTLDGPRWALIDAARADYALTKASPNIQRLTSVAGVTTKDLYQLFPKAPARTIAKIAGLPKPAGCL